MARSSPRPPGRPRMWTRTGRCRNGAATTPRLSGASTAMRSLPPPSPCCVTAPETGGAALALRAPLSAHARFVGAPARLQHVSTGLMRDRQIRLQFDRPVGGGERLIEPAEALE